MNEFRKPYEYVEEKRGYILLFIIMIITIDVFQGAIYLVPAYNEINHIPAFRVVFLVMSILYILFILFTAMTCYQLKNTMVTISKAYLIVRAVFMACCIIIIFLYNTNVESKIGFSKQYNTVFELYYRILIAPLAFVLVFSAGWYLYFLKSKRCKELVKNKAS